MKLTLSNLEEYVDPVILCRGMDYLQSGLVTMLREDSPGKISAEVKGTELYRVELLLSGDSVQESSCTCPYDKGPICKHVVAVLLALRDGSEEPDMVVEHELLSEYLFSRSKKQLVDLVVEHATEDAMWKELLLARVSISGEEASRHYEELLRSGIEAVEDRHGFIGYWEASQAASVAQGAEEGRDLHLRLSSRLYSCSPYSTFC